MATLVRDPNAKPVGQFLAPFKGTWSSLSAHMLQPDQLYASLNVFLRGGKLRDRAGLEPITTTFFDEVIIGGVNVTTPTHKVLLAFGRTTLYRLDNRNGEWTVDTAMDIAPADGMFVEVTFLETNSQYVAIVANGTTALKKWIDGQGLTTITAVKDPIPLATSVCTSASRIVALVNNHTLVWSDVLTYDSFSPLSYNKKLAETNDAGICIKSLSSYDFAVYKERSIYIGRAQAGADGNAFSVQRVQIVEGPASIKAVIDVGGYHMYMTANGRVGVFDGTSYVQWIADGLWLLLQDDIDTEHSDNIVGVFDYRLNTATFYYPRRGQGGLVKGMVVINIPINGSGLTEYACFLGESVLPVTHGYEMRFQRETNRSIIFTTGVYGNRSYICNEDYNFDGSVSFECMLQTGLLPLPDMKHNQVSAELFIERAQGNGTVDVSLVTSDALETASGAVEDLSSESLNLEFNPVREYVGFNKPTRFVGIKMEWRSDSTVRYAGAVVYGREVS